MMEVSYTKLVELVSRLKKADGREKHTFISVPDDEDIDKFRADGDLRHLASGYAHYDYDDLSGYTDFMWSDRLEPAFPPDSIDDIIVDIYSSLVDEPVGLAIVDNDEIIAVAKQDEIVVVDKEESDALVEAYHEKMNPFYGKTLDMSIDSYMAQAIQSAKHLQKELSNKCKEITWNPEG